MTQHQIVEEISKFTPIERLAIAKETLHQVQRELELNNKYPSGSKNGGTLKEAATALLSDYSSDKELTAFTALD